MSKDEILRVRVDNETVENLHKLGRELEQLRPGLDYSLSNLIRAAIKNYVEPPKKDPQKIEFRIPDNTSEEDIIEFWNLLTNAEAQLNQPGIVGLFEAVSDGLAVRYVTALKNVKQNEGIKEKTFVDKEG